MFNRCVVKWVSDLEKHETWGCDFGECRATFLTRTFCSWRRSYFFFLASQPCLERMKCCSFNMERLIGFDAWAVRRSMRPTCPSLICVPLCKKWNYAAEAARQSLDNGWIDAVDFSRQSHGSILLLMREIICKREVCTNRNLDVAWNRPERLVDCIHVLLVSVWLLGRPMGYMSFRDVGKLIFPITSKVQLTFCQPSCKLVFLSIIFMADVLEWPLLVRVPVI